MLIDFVHPAIVSGRGEDGRARHDVVRVLSHFDIAEYDGADAPVSFEYSNSGSYFLHPVRTIGDCHYLGLPYSKGVDGLREGNLFHEAIVGGTWDSFEPIWEIVRERASEIHRTELRAANNTRRDVTKRERSHGITPEGKACLKAPMLKPWRWLGPDADAQIAEWRSIVAEVLENAILVDGVLHVRCFEPCLVLDVANGDPKSEVSSRGVYQKQVHKREYDHNGLIVMGKHAKQTLSHYFAATDELPLEEMRAALGWKTGKKKWAVTVTDSTLASSDYLEMETVRHARILHEFGQQYAYQMGRRDQPEISAAFHQASDMLKTALLAWQDDELAFEGISPAIAPLADLIMEAPPVDRGTNRFGLDAVFCQRRIAHFGLREDMAEVSVSLPAQSMRRG